VLSIRFEAGGCMMLAPSGVEKGPLGVWGLASRKFLRLEAQKCYLH